MKLNKDIQLNKLLNVLVFSSFVVFIWVFLSKLLTYFYRIVIARYFGAEQYGLFSLASMIFILFVHLISLGLPEGLVRYISLYRGKKQYKNIKIIFDKSFSLLVLIGILGGLIMFFLSSWISLNIFHEEKLIVFVRIASLAIPFFVISNLYLSVLKSFERVGWYSFILNFVQNLSKLLSLLILIFFGLLNNTLMISYAIGIIIMFFLAYFVFSIKIKIPEGKKDPLKKGVMKELISYSWPLSLLGIVSFTLYWVDSFSIGYFQNVTAVGFYNAAVPIAALLMLAPDLIIQLFFPLVTKQYSENNHSLIEQLSKQVNKWIFLINLPLAAIFILFPGTILNFLFGSEYLVAENALRLLAFGSLFGSLSVVPAHLISMTGKSKKILSINIFMLILNFVLNFILVPRYGISGAAFSTMIIFLLLSSILIYETKRSLDFVPLRRKMLLALIASFIPLLLISSIKYFVTLNFLWIFVAGLVYILAYIALIFFLGCLDKHDFELINSFVKKRFVKKVKS